MKGFNAALFAVAFVVASPASAVNVWLDTAHHVFHDGGSDAYQQIDVTVDWSYENYMVVWHEDHAAIGLLSNGVPGASSQLGVGIMFGNFAGCLAGAGEISIAIEDFTAGGSSITTCLNVARDTTFPNKRARLVISALNGGSGKATVSADIYEPSSNTYVGAVTGRTTYTNTSSNRDIWVAGTGVITVNQHGCSPAMGPDCDTYLGWTVHSTTSY